MLVPWSDFPQGLKPDTHLVAFAAWLKPCPCYKTAGSLSFYHAVKSCLFIKLWVR